MNPTTVRRRPAATLAALMLLLSMAPASAQSPQVLAEDATRYLALGDSIAAGYKVAPVTQGYPYLLYQNGAFDRMPHTLFANAAVPGAASRDVLLYQVPQAVLPAAIGGFRPQYITLTVGGNDLLAVLRFAATHPDPNEVIQFAQGVLAQFGQNLGAILFQLQGGLPGVRIFVANQYTIPEIQAVLPFTDDIINAFNAVTANVIAQSGPNVFLVDIHGAFLGRNSLLWIDRPSAGPFEVHVTSVGHRVMEKTFADEIALHR